MTILQLLLELSLLGSAWMPLACLDSLLATEVSPQIPDNGSAPLLVDVHVFVSNVFDVNILQYTVSSALLLRLSWFDPHLSWHESTDPRSSITLPSNLLWTPDLTIREGRSRWRGEQDHLIFPPIFPPIASSHGVRMEAAKGGPDILVSGSSFPSLSVEWREHNPRARVSRKGFVELYTAVTTKTNCDFELLRFPSDKSDCNLSFYAFSNTVEELAFHPHAVNEIVSVKREYMVRGLKAQVPDQQLVPCFQVTLSLENTAIKTTMALVVPGVAILLADICGSLLPLKATERISYKVTLLLGYLVFHSSLVQALPSSSSCNPLLSKCLHQQGWNCTSLVSQLTLTSFPSLLWKPLPVASCSQLISSTRELNYNIYETILSIPLLSLPNFLILLFLLPVSYFTVLLILLSLSTMETVLMSGLLARGNFSPKSRPNPVPREVLDTANPKPRSEGRQKQSIKEKKRKP
ncbi:ligand-gated cation channel ZACN [Sarcophilus harrisii]